MTGGPPDWVTRQSRIAAEPLWWAWDAVLHHAAPLASLPGRIAVTGAVDPALLAGPLILVANHIGDYDAIVLAPSLYKVGIRPRFMATRGLMTARVLGPLLERAGFIRVDRGSGDARHALTVTDTVLGNNGHIVVYPEGRIGLDRDLWPERGRSGVARMALLSRVPVIPVTSWGAHEVLCYADDARKVTSLARSIWRQPEMKVHGANRCHSTTSSPAAPETPTGRGPGSSLQLRCSCRYCASTNPAVRGTATTPAPIRTRQPRPFPVATCPRN